MASARWRARHVVLVPFPGQGHLAGFLAIARLLRVELPDATVTVVSTPRNVAALRASTADECSLSFHALPFVPSDHGLPAGCESCSSLPMPLFINLFEAFESLEPALDAYISGLRRESDDAEIGIIADAFVAWTVRAARRHGCAHALFVSCGAFGTAVLHALWKHMPDLPIGSGDGVLRLPEYPELALHRSQLSPALLFRGETSDRWTAFFHRIIQHGYLTDAVLANTVQELEPAGLAMVARALGNEVAVWPVGPLVRADDSSEVARDGVLRWLDSQQPASVLYISFGSQNTIAPNQMMELAAALECTGRPFVWAIRPPVGFDIAGEFRDEWLPEGFEARARATNRGVLVHGWAPQLRILAHPATGAFLSHCGWNSVLESLARGVPIVGWPLAAEQFYNVMMLAKEWGVCVELARGNTESSHAVQRSKVAELLDTVMGDAAESAAMRRRVADVQDMLKGAWAAEGGSSRKALHDFFTAMRLQ